MMTVLTMPQRRHILLVLQTADHATVATCYILDPQQPAVNTEPVFKTAIVMPPTVRDSSLSLTQLCTRLKTEMFCRAYDRS